ncbi:hypothetical protein FB550_12288 [Neobacillus bataviensis]|uniref:Uncharacterized protein n=1 Tax=Neobacillus bataviensis TaxID=220685 RepID=A0A561CGV1_9BACI|nr:hypothetical protein [Neobacillus bataviensis]TWD90324.1 hypothetical protein FB550_12288 [Neobacillus bataviensis]
MINLTLGNISITSVGQSSGFFMGGSNTHKKFRSSQVVNEVLGVLSGDENRLTENKWLENNQKERSE